MSKSATEVMQDIVVATAIESIMALKAASKGMPNTLLRDLNAIHANTTFADLPKELQDSINSGVRSALSRLLKEGYAVAPRDTVQPERRPPPRGPRDGGHPDRRPPRRGPDEGGRPFRGPRGGRPKGRG